MPCQSCVPGRCSPGLRSVKLRPHKNMLGQVVAPARAWLTAAEDPTEPPDPDMPLLPARRRRPELRDTRGSKRRLVLAADHKRSATSDGFEVTAAKPACLAAGTVLNVAGSDESTELGEIPRTEQSLVLHRGNILQLTRDCSPALVGTGHGAPGICGLTHSTMPAPATGSTSTTARSAARSSQWTTARWLCVSISRRWPRQSSRPASE